jgi:hypothetical protein
MVRNSRSLPVTTKGHRLRSEPNAIARRDESTLTAVVAAREKKSGTGAVDMDRRVRTAPPQTCRFENVERENFRLDPDCLALRIPSSHCALPISNVKRRRGITFFSSRWQYVVSAFGQVARAGSPNR